MDQSTAYWVILGAANIPVFLLAAWGIFNSWDGFVESVKYVLMPWQWAWLRGEGVEHDWSELKFVLFLAVCAGWVALVHIVLQTYVLT